LLFEAFSFLVVVDPLLDFVHFAF